MSITATHDWQATSRRLLCPICGRDHRCDISADGNVAKCYRVADGAFKHGEDVKGQYHIHRLRDDAPAPRPRKRPKVKPASAVDWSAVHDTCTDAINYVQVEALSMNLMVAIESLYAIRVGWHDERRCYTFPERDARGNIIGIATRTPAGRKRFLPGGNRGLTLPDSLNLATADTLLIVEGPTDVTACCTLGIPAVGRPSNVGGIDLLVDLLNNYTGEIFVVGENDKKADGDWPGRDGAIRTARELANQLKRPVAWTLLPHGSKDIRNWLADHDAHLTEHLRDMLI